MIEETKNNLGLAKKVIFNRRYRTWKQWFYALLGVAILCVFRDSLELFEAYAMWSSIGLVALIGGLSATDFIKIKNGMVK